MAKDTDLRNPDIENILRTRADMGRPVKSDIIRDKQGNQVFYGRDVKGRVQIKEVVPSGR